MEIHGIGAGRSVPKVDGILQKLKKGRVNYIFSIPNKYGGVDKEKKPTKTDHISLISEFL